MASDLRQFFRERKTEITSVLAVVLFYAVLQCLGITCPILFLTGVSCAGCGMTRAWLSLLRLDLAGAFAYHPLFWIPVPALLLFLLRRRIPRRVLQLCAGVILFLFLAVYVIRMADPPDTIVVFHPREGLFFRAAAALAGLIRELLQAG